MSACRPHRPQAGTSWGVPLRNSVSDGRLLFLPHPVCHAISNSKTSSGGSWWPPICLAEGWTLSESTSSSTMTCLRTRTPTSTE